MPARTMVLKTPQLPLLVEAAVFDGFAWNPSTVMEWHAPDGALEINHLNGELPLGLAFVFRGERLGLPSEYARLHVSREHGLRDEWCLAPFAIDDATDTLFDTRSRAHDVFWVAADSLNALYWALHDWAHFHNHGEFVERVANEVQCDASALAWLWLNRADLPLTDDAWENVRAGVYANHLRHRAAEPPQTSLDDAPLRDPDALRALADRLIANSHG